MTVIEQVDFVVLSVYMRPDLAEVSRVLQVLVRQRLTVERFNANVSPVDVSGINGLEVVTGPVMKLVVTGSVSDDRTVERSVKALNRLTQVYKVRADAR